MPEPQRKICVDLFFGFLVLIFTQFFYAGGSCLAAPANAESLLKENAQLTKEVYLLSRELDSLSAENSKLTRRLNQCERSLKEVTDREALGSGRAEYESLKVELEKAGADLNAAEEYIKELQDENKKAVIELKRHQAKSRSEREALQKSFQSEENNAVSVTISELTEKNNALQEQLKGAGQEHARLKQEIESKEVYVNLLNNEIKNLKNNISQFAQVLKEAEDKNIVLENSLASANARLDEMGAENSGLKKKVSALENSLVNKIYEHHREAGAGAGAEQAAAVGPDPEKILLKQENEALKARVEFLEQALLNLGEDAGPGQEEEAE